MATLYHADATEILDVLREHEPAAVIMDPPYWAAAAQCGTRFNNGARLDRPRKQRLRENAVIPRFTATPREWTLTPWIGFASDVILWGADHMRAQLPAGGRFIGWDKLAGMQPWDYFSDIEFAWHSRKGKATIISHKWKGLVASKYGEADSLGIRHHPMQKPIRVMQWCIRECRLEPGATILDPYMGSGTTGIAAFGMDMKFVGVEIERRWFDAAVARITERCDEGLFA